LTNDSNSEWFNGSENVIEATIFSEE